MGRYQIYKESTEALGLEPSTTYHDSEAIANAFVAEAYANAEANLVHTSVRFTRWEWYNPAGDKVSEGSLSGIIGEHTGDMMPAHYALYLRCNNTGGGGRASGRYIHFFPESFNSNGNVTAGFNTAFGLYNTAIDNIATNIDSNGITVASHTFRGFSRRRKVRRKSL